jgi:DNA-binding NarL/FixJ family response regulator
LNAADRVEPHKRRAKVIIAEPLTLMREGLAAICASAPTLYEVIGQCADGEIALGLIRQLQPDIAVLDLHLPSLDSIEVIRQVKASDLSTKTAVLSSRGDRKTVLEALRGGASAFLLKTSPAKHLLDSFEQILNGGIYLSPELNMDEIFLTRSKMDPDDPLDNLSPREFQVFTLLVEGLRPKDIGDRLRLSPKTVDTYRASMMDKLGIHDIAGLVKYAFHRDLVA